MLPNNFKRTKKLKQNYFFSIEYFSMPSVSSFTGLDINKLLQ